MNAKELAEKFMQKLTRLLLNESVDLADYEQSQKRSEDIEHCNAMEESNVLPFLAELKQHTWAKVNSTFAPQIDMQDHKPVGVSSRSVMEE